MIICKQAWPIVLVNCLAITSVANGTTLIADFDQFPEGSLDTQFSDNGIQFSHLEVEALGGTPRFSAERADANGWPHVSPPNYLSTFGFFPGPGGGLSQVRAFRIAPPSAARSVDIDVFASIHPEILNRVYTLTAFLGNDVVATQSVVIGEGTTIVPNFAEHHLFRINRVKFDSLRFSATDGAGNPSAILAATDNVVIRLVPEPTARMLTFIAAIFAAGRRRL